VRTTHRYICVLIMLTIISCTSHSYSGENALVVLTEKQGVLKSTNGGRSWENFNTGLPTGVIPVRLYASRTALFLGTYDTGLFRFDFNGVKWEPVNSDDLHLRSLYRSDSRYRKITAFSADPRYPEKLVIATKHSVYSSTDNGKHWSIVAENGFDRRNYILSLSLQGGTVFTGTSFGGIYSRSQGPWMRRVSGLHNENYSNRITFYEQINVLATHGNTIYAGTDFGKGIYTSTKNGRSWKKVSLPPDHGAYESVYDIQCTDDELYVAMGTNILMKKHSGSAWSITPLSQVVHSLPDELSPLGIMVIDMSRPPLYFSIIRDRKSDSRASSRKAIYASIPAIRRNLKGLIWTIKKCGFNAIVIDMKDDSGDLYFPTKSKIAREINAARRPVNVSGILRSLHENGIYAIARMVVFKDKRLFDGYSNKYAIINYETKEPWQGNEREFWVDPHARFVHEYTIALARELQDIGFDEIQFDYIRFPSDGPIHLCHYPFREHRDSYKSEILSDFLFKAKSLLRIPVSTDIYGFNSWYHFGDTIGQDMEAFARIVDVICPMVYPSHFGQRFYSGEPEESRPYLIVHDGGIRAHRLLQHASVIRPYLQAFDLRSPTWGPEYVKRQVDGAEKSGCSGFTFWNAKGEYGTVIHAFEK
jgi:hypothetical protein